MGSEERPTYLKPSDSTPAKYLRRRFDNWTPSVMVADEKHVQRFFAALTVSEALDAALYLVKERLTVKRWYDGDENYDSIVDAVERGDRVEAFYIIEERNDWEYEHVGIHPLEKVGATDG